MNIYEPGEIREQSFELQGHDMLRRAIREMTDEQVASFAKGIMAGSDRPDIEPQVRFVGFSVGMIAAAELARRRHERDRLEQQFATSIVDGTWWSPPSQAELDEGVDELVIELDEPGEPRERGVD